MWIHGLSLLAALWSARTRTQERIPTGNGTSSTQREFWTLVTRSTRTARPTHAIKDEFLSHAHAACGSVCRIEGSSSARFCCYSKPKASSKSTVTLMGAPWLMGARASRKSQTALHSSKKSNMEKAMCFPSSRSPLIPSLDVQSPQLFVPSMSLSKPLITLSFVTKTSHELR